MTILLILALLAVAGGASIASFRAGRKFERKMLTEHGYVRLTSAKPEDLTAALEEMKVEGYLPAVGGTDGSATESIQIAIPGHLPPDIMNCPFRSLSTLFSKMLAYSLKVDDVLPDLAMLTQDISVPKAIKELNEYCSEASFGHEPSEFERLFIEFMSIRINARNCKCLTNYLLALKGTDSSYRTALLALDRFPDLNHKAVAEIKRFCSYGLKKFVDFEGTSIDWTGPANHEKTVRLTARDIAHRRNISY